VLANIVVNNIRRTNAYASPYYGYPQYSIHKYYTHICSIYLLERACNIHSVSKNIKHNIIIYICIFFPIIFLLYYYYFILFRFFFFPKQPLWRHRHANVIPKKKVFSRDARHLVLSHVIITIFASDGGTVVCTAIEPSPLKGPTVYYYTHT